MELKSYGIDSLAGVNIKLTPLTEDMITKEYLSWLKNTDVNQYMEVRFDSCIENSLVDFIKDVNKSPDALILAIRDENDRHIGNIKINWDPNHMVGDIGIMIGDKDSWGKGIGSNAVQLMTKFSTDIIGLHKIIGGIYERNFASKCIFQKSGFAREAILKNQALVSGEYENIEIWTYFQKRSKDKISSDQDQRGLTKVLLDQCKLETSYRLDKINDWQEVWENHGFQKIKYSNNRIEYEINYLKSYYPFVVDLSIVIYLQKKPIAIFPLIAYGSEGIENVSGGASKHLYDLLFVTDLTDGVIEATSKKLYRFLEALFNKGLENIGISQNIDLSETLEKKGLSKLLATCLYGGAEVSKELDMYLYLSPPYDLIKSHFRKSYLSLVNSGLQNFETCIMDFSNFEEDKWKSFVQLHYEVAERITRNEGSWKCQANMVKSDFAFMVIVSSVVDKKIVGVGFFEKTKDEAQYSVAAYRRSLTQFPLGHLVQNAAIKYMKNRGIKWYYLGESWEINSNVLRSKKEKSISFFKRGFMSHLFPRHLVLLHLPHRDK